VEVADIGSRLVQGPIDLELPLQHDLQQKTPSTLFSVPRRRHSHTPAYTHTHTHTNHTQFHTHSIDTHAHTHTQSMHSTGNREARGREGARARVRASERETDRAGGQLQGAGDGGRGGVKLAEPPPLDVGADVLHVDVLHVPSFLDQRYPFVEMLPDHLYCDTVLVPSRTLPGMHARECSCELVCLFCVRVLACTRAGVCMCV